MRTVVTPPPGSTDAWFTPQWLWDELHAEFGFTLDVAACSESARTPRFYTQADDGLRLPWSGARVWCNPPYSDIAPWVERAAFLTSQGALPLERALLVVQLLPAWTDRRWWHAWVEPARLAGRLEVRFLPGRLRFGWPGNPSGAGQRGSASFPSAVLVWRPPP